MPVRAEVLSAEEREQVHERTLSVLERVGVRCDTDEGRRILAEAGACVDHETRIVRFPPELVERSLAAAGRHFTLGGRRPGFGFAVNRGEHTLLADGGATSVFDATLGCCRPTTHDDWLAATRLLDALDDVGLYWSPTEYPPDFATPTGFVRFYVDVFSNFSKHVQDAYGTRQLTPWFKEIVDILFGGRDRVRELAPFSFLLTPTSPLIIERDFTDAWLSLRDYGLPVAIMPMPLQGATAPGTRLATLLAANCETVAALCLVQAAAPGTPVLYAPTPAAMDPRTGLLAGGAIEHAVSCAACTEMARFYGLGAESSGSSTQTFVPDLQTALEKANNILPATLSDPDILCGPGLLAGSTVLSLEQILLDVLEWRQARQACTGVPVRDDLWLDDVLAAVGPGGSFLGERSTRVNIRTGEWRLNEFGMFGGHDAWRAAGSPTTLDHARRKVEEILGEHKSLPLDEDVIAALAELQKRADAAS
jgi:trimethylamine---corrinoid protein Co-methyltransferase